MTSETVQLDPAGNNGTIGYSYDPVGNRQQRTSSITPVPAQSFSYDANDRISSVGYGYDANGSTTTDPNGTYTYDALGRLTSATVNGVTSTYVYDGDGDKVEDTSNDTTHAYLLDNTNLTGYSQVLETLTNGSLDKVYTYGLNRISEDQFDGTNWNLSFYGYDGQGSVRYLMDGLGNVTDTYTYDAFGDLISSTGSTKNVFRYDGEQVDLNTGFYNLRARWMNPGIGRFQTMDTYEGQANDPPSLHKYTFASNDPENREDPSGNDDIFSLSASEPTLFWPSDFTKRSYFHTPSFEGQLFIKSWERLSLAPYDNDGANNATIGWGHLLHPGPLTVSEKIQKLLHANWITQSQAEDYFQSDLSEASLEVEKNVDVPLYQYEYDALVSLAFNVTPYSFENSTVIKDLKTENYVGAGCSFPLLSFARTKGGSLEFIKGLYNRRQAESKMFLNNVYNHL